MGREYPHAVATWEAAWERFIPCLAIPPELRRVTYTTNSIESLDYQLRKIIKNRGHFPNDDAVTKLLWLAICNIEDKRARQRAKEKDRRAAERKSPRPARRGRDQLGRPWPSSRSRTPNASTRTSDRENINNKPDRLHRKLDRLRAGRGGSRSNETPASVTAQERRSLQRIMAKALMGPADGRPARPHRWECSTLTKAPVDLASGRREHPTTAARGPRRRPTQLR